MPSWSDSQRPVPPTATERADAALLQVHDGARLTARSHWTFWARQALLDGEE